MHRSGTSALTHVLGLAGATLPRHLMGATDANERGYFESLPIYRLHEEMLEAFGTSCYDLSSMPDGWVKSGLAVQFVDRMVDVVREEFGGSPLFVVKDPRLCRLVPFWLEVLSQLEIEPSFVIPVRNPLEVSASLERADDIDPQRGRLLWLQHFLLAERDSRGRNRSFVTYDQLLDDWRTVIEQVGSELDLVLPRLSRRAGAEIDNFLSDELRHHDLPTKGVEIRADVGEWIKKAYAWAERAAHGKRPASRTLDAVADAFLTAEEAFGPVVATSEHRRLEEADAATRLREELANRPVDPGTLVVGDPASGLESRMNELSAFVKQIMLAWASSVQADRGAPILQLLQSMQERNDPLLPDVELVQLAAYRESMEADVQISERVRELEGELARSTAEIERLRPLEPLVSEMQGGLSQLNALRSERDREVFDLRALVPEVEVLRKSMEAASADRGTELGRVMEQHQEMMAVGDATIARLREEAQHLAGVESRLAERDRTIETLGESVQRLGIAEVQVQERDVEIARLRQDSGRLVELEVRLAQRDADVTRLREVDEKLAGLGVELTNRETELASIREEMERSSMAFDRLRIDADEFANAASVVPELEEELRARESELNDLRNEVLRIPRIRQRLLESEAARERVEEDAELALVEKTSEIRRLIEQRDVETTRLRAEARELPDLRSRLRESEETLEQAEKDIEVLRALLAEEEGPALPGPLLEPVHAPVETKRGGSRILALPRRVAKLVYWTSTFQLNTRLRERRAAQRLRESGLFDDHFYRDQASDVAEDGGDPVFHYLRHGVNEGRNPSAAFDTLYYLESNPDVRNTGLNPLDHFATHGWREGRSPHPRFDVGYYLSVNPDVAASGENPLHHWLYNGRSEGRATTRRQSAKIGAAACSASSVEIPEAKRLTISEETTPPVGINTRISLERLSNIEDEAGRAADSDDPIVVVVSHELPHPPRAGNQYRISRYIAWLQERGYQVVTVFSPLPSATPSEKVIREAARVLKNLIVCHRDGRLQVSVAPHLFDLLAGLDRQRVSPYDPAPERFEGEQEDEYRERLVLERTFCPDVLVHLLVHIDQHLERPSVFITCYAFATRYLSLLRDETLSVIDTIDVFSSKEKKVDAFGVFNELRLTEIQERALLLRGDVTMAIQAAEGREFERLVPDRAVLTIGVDFDCAPEASAPLPDVPPTVALVASGNAMNVKGINDFLRHCWPLILRDHPKARFRVAGAIGQFVPKESPGVDILGKVDSLGEFYQSCHVAINPAQAGTGLKIKTVESIAHYRPVVTWPLGVEGVPEPLLRFCGVAHDWYEFYMQVSKALNASAGESTFSLDDRKYVVETLSSRNVYRLLGDMIDQHCRIVDSEQGTG